jgi:hypothetical protein
VRVLYDGVRETFILSDEVEDRLLLLGMRDIELLYGCRTSRSGQGYG